MATSRTDLQLFVFLQKIAIRDTNSCRQADHKVHGSLVELFNKNDI